MRKLATCFFALAICAPAVYAASAASRVIPSTNTKTNADTDGRVINQYIENYVKENSEKACVFDSLGQLRYLSAIQYCDAVIGNSSSGLLEVPFFKKPTVNIGIRQGGRLKAESIIECDFAVNNIIKAINKAVSEKFNKQIQHIELLYGEGNTSEQILNILKQVELENITIKKFYDL